MVRYNILYLLKIVHITRLIQQNLQEQINPISSTHVISDAYVWTESTLLSVIILTVLFPLSKMGFVASKSI